MTVLFSPPAIPKARRAVFQRKALEPACDLVYHSIDEVSLDWLYVLADRHGLTFRHHEPRDGLARFPVVLIDADTWWYCHKEREQGLLALTQMKDGPRVIAIHGWQLRDEQIQVLRAAGYHMRHALDDALLLEIAQETQDLT